VRDPNHRAHGRRQGRCKVCVRASIRQWQLDNPEKLSARQRVYRIRHKYGVEPAELDALLRSQGGRCAICGDALTMRTLKVDHSHVTGRVRGLLCHGCNTGIGFLREDVAVMEAAIAYVRRHS
jgi:hypothetical protein